MRCRPFCPDSHLARTWFGSASRGVMTDKPELLPTHLVVQE